MQAVQAAQLVDRPLVVVHAQVDEDVGEAGVAAVPLDDEERGRLLAARVATGGLAGREGLEQSLGERARCGLEGLRERVDRGFGDEDVALRGVAVARAAAGPVEALRARVRGRAALGVHDADLPLVAPVVRLGQTP